MVPRMMNDNCTNLVRVSGGRCGDIRRSSGTFYPAIWTRVVESLDVGRNARQFQNSPPHAPSEHGVCEQELTAMCIWFPSRNRRSASP